MINYEVEAILEEGMVCGPVRMEARAWEDAHANSLEGWKSPWAKSIPRRDLEEFFQHCALMECHWAK